MYWEEGQRWVKLRICTKAIKTLEKRGLGSMASEAGISLWELPYEDARPQRKAFLAENKGKVPVAANPRAMKNPEKLAASKKQPKYPVYEEGGRIVWIRPGGESGQQGVDPAPGSGEGGAGTAHCCCCKAHSLHASSLHGPAYCAYESVRYPWHVWRETHGCVYVWAAFAPPPQPTERKHPMGPFLTTALIMSCAAQAWRR